MKPSLKARATLKDVARAVGVSHTTVSNAFSRPDQLSSDLRERILAAARSMSYPGPNPAARMLRTGFAKTIAVVWTDPMPHAFEDQAAAAFLAGVAEACAERDLGLLLVQGGDASFRSLQDAAIDGLIFTPCRGMKERLGLCPTALCQQSSWISHSFQTSLSSESTIARHRGHARSISRHSAINDLE
jgi:DNA-binding LacI/PurR family transcriptional regulator